MPSPTDPSTGIPDSALLDAVLAIAAEAARQIMVVHDSADLEIAHKADTSPVTRADLAAHEAIAEGLARVAPQWPLLSEEDVLAPYEVRRRWQRYWLVDPLDGTREFIQRNGEFTVNIALIDDGRPIVGVIHLPTTGVAYLGVAGAGCWRIENGRRTRLAVRPTIDPPVVAHSRSHPNAALGALLERLPAHRALRIGSSLKFCRIAEGEADFYPRTGPTSEWDTAAGQCIAEAAGAKVIQLPDGGPLRYNTRETPINPMFAVIADPTYAWMPYLEALQ